jgi:catechol 2,3-dioxygenase-like lactoylglutathione lyase family enzyme
MFKETHPILGARDIQRAVELYTQQLGFRLAFGDKADPPNYVGVCRDAVVLHMQFQFEYGWARSVWRFLVEAPDALFHEDRQRGVECTPTIPTSASIARNSCVCDHESDTAFLKVADLLP